MCKHTSSFSPPYTGEGPQASPSPLSVMSRILVDVALPIAVPSTCFLGMMHRGVRVTKQGLDSVHRCFESLHMDVEVCDDMTQMGLERLTLCSSHLIYI